MKMHSANSERGDDCATQQEGVDEMNVAIRQMFHTMNDTNQVALNLSSLIEGMLNSEKDDILIECMWRSCKE